ERERDVGSREHLRGSNSALGISQMINAAVGAGAGEESTVERAVGVHARDVRRGLSVDKREVSAQHHFSVQLGSNSAHSAIGSRARIKGGIQRAVRQQSRDMVLTGNSARSREIAADRNPVPP